MSNQEMDNNSLKKPRGRPRVKPIKDENEPKRPRGRQAGFKPDTKTKIELDPIILKQKKAEINKKSFAKRGKMVQYINKIVKANNLKELDYKNMTDETLKLQYDEFLKYNKSIKEEKKINKIEQKLKEQLKNINPSITFI